MIQHFVRNKATRAQLRATPLASQLDGFAGAMVATGYCRCTGYRYLDAAGHLGQWCKHRDTELRGLDNTVVAQFIAHVGKCSCSGAWRQGRRDAAAGARCFLKYLHGHGVVDCYRNDALPNIVREFCSWMRAYRGVSAGTLRIYAPLLTEFVAAQKTTPASYDARALRAFVLKRAQGVRSDRARSVSTALRMFIAFLASTGRCPSALIGAVPTHVSSRLAKLPRHLTPPEIQTLVASFDTKTLIGTRNRAMILLMARLGLRTAEVASLRVADLDWSGSRILVLGKGAYEGCLPLPQEVGDSILQYLAKRPRSVDAEHVFVRSVPPRRCLAPRSISDMFVVAARRAGLGGRFGGAHILRHSLATNMLAAGASLEQIGTLLRHSSMETTAIYAKVDFAALRRIAQPWPFQRAEVQPC